MRGILALEKPQSTASLDTGGHLQVHSMCAGAGIAVTLEEQRPAVCLPQTGASSSVCRSISRLWLPVHLSWVLGMPRLPAPHLSKHFLVRANIYLSISHTSSVRIFAISHHQLLGPQLILDTACSWYWENLHLCS